ncbi:MAG TPA: MBL fold metallo-hydrolase [Firmicutes bacterium]|nr:MBL fold metallo-hydrolase [Bacillota bacterium]
MIEKVLPGIFRIALPMPGSPLQSVNTYLLRGKERDLLIDSGINQKECKTALIKALSELDVSMEQTDFFITHLHEDHFGLAPILATDKSTIYLNFPETAFWADPGRWNTGLDHGRKNGFPGEELNRFFKKTPGFLKRLPLDEMAKAVQFYQENIPAKGIRLQIIGDGERLNIGGYSLVCLFTPGHSSGHICLYEPDKKFLFSGDHILETITPAIFLWSGESWNPLHEYLKSLDKVLRLEIDIVLPGHRGIFRDCRARVAEIKKHHSIREGEIASVLDANGKSAYEIASNVSWNIPLPWEQFSVELRWMALAETLAHLKYMEERGKTTVKPQDNGLELYYPPR